MTPMRLADPAHAPTREYRQNQHRLQQPKASSGLRRGSGRSSVAPPGNASLSGSGRRGRRAGWGSSTPTAAGVSDRYPYSTRPLRQWQHPFGISGKYLSILEDAGDTGGTSTHKRDRPLAERLLPTGWFRGGSLVVGAVGRPCGWGVLRWWGGVGPAGMRRRAASGAAQVQRGCGCSASSARRGRPFWTSAAGCAYAVAPPPESRGSVTGRSGAARIRRPRRRATSWRTSLVAPALP